MKKQAFKESLTDTTFATFINIPINFVLALLAVEYAWTATQITFGFTAIFFIIAVYRKYRVRLYFAKKETT
jgi:ABC-type bacteriocin/lantibiotic exporter with double-glycine peptidase domain